MDGLLAALVPLLGLVLDRAGLLALRAVAGAIFRVITELEAVRRPGLDGRHGGRRGVGGPTGIMTAWRRSLVTITATGLATLKVGELTQILVSGGGNIGSGASTRAVQTAAVGRVAVTGGV